jgi:RNA recognition motif-containing protein
MRIFVGNLPWSFNDSSLRDLFSKFGQVISAVVIQDKITRKSKGYGFVEMSDEEAKVAIESLNGSEVDGRPIVANEARPRTE